MAFQFLSFIREQGGRFAVRSGRPLYVWGLDDQAGYYR